MRDWAAYFPSHKSANGHAGSGPNGQPIGTFSFPSNGGPGSGLNGTEDIELGSSGDARDYDLPVSANELAISGSASASRTNTPLPGGASRSSTDGSRQQRENPFLSASMSKDASRESDGGAAARPRTPSARGPGDR